LQGEDLVDAPIEPPGEVIALGLDLGQAGTQRGAFGREPPPRPPRPDQRQCPGN
jgi:hypothetical protein